MYPVNVTYSKNSAKIVWIMRLYPPNRPQSYTFEIWMKTRYTSNYILALLQKRPNLDGRGEEEEERKV